MNYDEKILYDQYIRDLHAVTQQLNVALENIREEEVVLEVHVAHLESIGEAYHFLRHEAKVVAIHEIELLRYDLKAVKDRISTSQLSLVSLKRYADDQKILRGRIKAKIDAILSNARRGVVIEMPRRSRE